MNDDDFDDFDDFDEIFRNMGKIIRDVLEDSFGGDINIDIRPINISGIPVSRKRTSKFTGKEPEVVDLGDELLIVTEVNPPDSDIEVVATPKNLVIRFIANEFSRKHRYSPVIDTVVDLPDNLKISEAKGIFKNGILEITIPKGTEESDVSKVYIQIKKE